MQNNIIYLCADNMNWFEVLKLKIFSFLHKDYKIALDMKFSKDIKEDFLHFIKTFSNENKLNIFNINTELMMILGLRNLAQYVNIYADESDFLDNTRSLVNRKFRVY